MVSAVAVWTNVGYVTLFFLAGILAIPDEIHAAARTDGATSWQRFWRITLPMLRPTLFFVWSPESSVPHRFSTPSTR